MPATPPTRPAPLTPDRWRRIQAVFHEAAEHPAAARAALRDAACAADLDLRRAVERMLAADADASARLAPAVAVPDAAPDGAAPDLAERLQAALGEAYRVGAELAGGGMSRVFVAEEVRLGRRVAVKVLPPELGVALGAERFEREARLIAALRHPHNVPLLAAGEGPGGLLYYTTPYVEGESLRQRLDRAACLPLAEAAAIVRDVAGALAYAHARGVVHRDVKPANVLMDGPHALVADFGIARVAAPGDADAAIAETTAPRAALARPGATLTRAGFVLGTPAYMSPEQARGELVDARSDVYALGAVATELLTGRHRYSDAGPPSAGRRWPARRAAVGLAAAAAAAVLAGGAAATRRATGPAARGRGGRAGEPLDQRGRAAPHLAAQHARVSQQRQAPGTDRPRARRRLPASRARTLGASAGRGGRGARARARERGARERPRRHRRVGRPVRGRWRRPSGRRGDDRRARGCRVGARPRRARPRGPRGAPDRRL